MIKHEYITANTRQRILVSNMGKVIEAVHPVSGTVLFNADAMLGTFTIIFGMESGQWNLI